MPREPKRHKLSVPDKKRKGQVMGISDPALRRLILRSRSALQMRADVFDAMRELVKPHLEETIREAILFAASDKRHTVTTQDVENALKRQDRTTYGLKT